VPGPSVAAYVLQRLIPEDNWRQELSWLSCARDQGEAIKLAETYLPWNRASTCVSDAEKILRANGWTDGGGDYFVPDRFLRVLLLHQLRGQAAISTVAQVHATLIAPPGQQNSGALSTDEPRELYHCLARGEVVNIGYVARRLGESLASPQVDKWLTALVQIAAAPCNASPDVRRKAALGKSDDPSHDEVQRAVWRLLNAAWYLHDPLVAPDGEVIDKLSAELQLLAWTHPHGNLVFNEAAREWPARLRNWQQDWKPTI
jgi:hypothetical protein